ncbi:MAG: SPOR domain-containing protein, partial [Halofilum sp. (in: g-proteobacteria)]|nr:SPOR domain-containing protein [Halofilum sp. (in: g-proteobacteria)]
VEAVPGGTPIDGAAPAAAAMAPEEGDLFVQVGAFRRYANAQQMRARIQGADIRGVEVAGATASDGRKLYRVRIGPLADAAEGERILSTLERAGIGPAHVVAE